MYISEVDFMYVCIHPYRYMAQVNFECPEFRGTIFCQDRAVDLYKQTSILNLVVL